jgi:signal transduction histidine kinase/CheY-like chemotaxis protein
MRQLEHPPAPGASGDAGAERGPLHILLVEDNPGDAGLVRRYLEEAPLEFRLVEATTLAEAAVALDGQRFDAVLLDLSLPDAQGVQTVERAIALAPGQPILVLTGLNDESVAVEAVQAGAQDYLEKGSITPVGIARALRYAMERRRAADTQRFLARAGSVLSGSLDYQATLQSVADLATPLLADWCVSYVVEGDRVMRVAASHADPDRRDAVRALGSNRNDLTPGHPVRQSLESGEPVLATQVPRGMLESVAESPAHLEALQRLGLSSLMVTPMIARGRILGAIAFVAADARRAYGADDLALAKELAGRAALAVDNARLYESQRAARERAERAVKTRDEVLGVVAHDLRNPLSGIRMAAEVALGDGVPEERRLQMLETIIRSTERMDDLIEDLLDVSRIEAGVLRVEPVSAAPAVLLADAVEALAGAAGPAGVFLHMGDAESLPRVLADPDRIRQVLVNIGGNAIRYTPSGGTVTFTAEEAEGKVSFSVADTGCGIEPGSMEALFDRFWQGGKERKGGAGLGLSIARGIVEAHGGRIWVTSVEGQGATFHFTLPVSPRPEASSPGRSDPSRRRSLPASTSPGQPLHR